MARSVTVQGRTFRIELKVQNLLNACYVAFTLCQGEKGLVLKRIPPHKHTDAAVARPEDVKAAADCAKAELAGMGITVTDVIQDLPLKR